MQTKETQSLIVPVRIFVSDLKDPPLLSSNKYHRIKYGRGTALCNSTFGLLGDRQSLTTGYLFTRCHTDRTTGSYSPLRTILDGNSSKLTTFVRDG